MPRATQLLLAGVALVTLALTLPAGTPEPSGARVTTTETDAPTGSRAVATGADAAEKEERRPLTSAGHTMVDTAFGPALVPSRPPRGGGSVAGRDARDDLPDATSPEGFVVASGSSEAGAGSEITYTVELEAAVEVDLIDLVEVVEESLYDARSWANDHTLRRVDDPDDARIRVLLATPGTVDQLCARAGLNTAGIYSCWNGRFAALNSLRWLEGAWSFGDDLATYRRYLVNHEFGHGLGYGHVGCPGSGTPAPIMMQQSKDTGACEPNGWPYPHLGDDD